MNYLRQILEALKSIGLLHSDVQEISTKIESATAEYKTQTNKEKPTPVVNAVLSRPQAEIDQENARETRKEEREGRAEERDTRRLQIEAIALVIGAVVAAANIGLWIVTMQSASTARRVAIASEKGATAAADQVKATKDSIDTTVKQFKLDQRAWVVASGFRLVDFVANKPVKIDLAFTNSGRTPAKVTSDILKVYPSFKPDIETLLNSKEWKSGEKQRLKISTDLAVIFPNIPATIPMYGSGPVEQWQVQQLSEGKIFLYVVGEIYYSDVFGENHVTKFCGLYAPKNGTFEYCSEENYAD